MKLKLKSPIQAHGEQVNHLTFRTPKGRDFKTISGQSLEQPFQAILDFAATLADVPPSAMDELIAEDVNAVTELIGPYLGKSL